MSDRAIEVTVTRESILDYADATGDVAAAHVDLDAACALGLTDLLGHGPFVVAVLDNLLARSGISPWRVALRLSGSFVAGDTIRVELENNGGGDGASYRATRSDGFAFASGRVWTGTPSHPPPGARAMADRPRLTLDLDRGRLGAYRRATGAQQAGVPFGFAAWYLMEPVRRMLLSPTAPRDLGVSGSLLLGELETVMTSPRPGDTAVVTGGLAERRRGTRFEVLEFACDASIDGKVSATGFFCVLAQ